MMKRNFSQRGISLVEVLVGVAIFLLVAVGIFQSFVLMMRTVASSQQKNIALDLANEQVEIVRNLPYASVGISGSIPSGPLAHEQTIVRDDIPFTVLTTIRNYDDPTDCTINSGFNCPLGGNHVDTSPADAKIVEIEVDCLTCQNFSPIVLTTRVAPKNLETASANGALNIRVADSDGNVLPGALVHIVNNQVNPPVVIDDSTNDVGVLQIIDAPPGADAYQVSVTKPGFTTDRTYAPTELAPSAPINGHASVFVQQVAPVNLTIDRASQLDFSTVDASCQPVGGVDFKLDGGLLIGTGPDHFKYHNTTLTTDSSGHTNLVNLEWGSYAAALTDPAFVLLGANPALTTTLSAGVTQAIKLAVAPSGSQSVVISVADVSTEAPLAGASIELSGPDYNQTAVTGACLLPGQALFGALNPGLYTATTTLSGYAELVSTFTVAPAPAVDYQDFKLTPQ